MKMRLQRSGDPVPAAAMIAAAMNQQWRSSLVAPVCMSGDRRKPCDLKKRLFLSNCTWPLTSWMAGPACNKEEC